MMSPIWQKEKILFHPELSFPTYLKTAFLSLLLTPSPSYCAAVPSPKQSLLGTSSREEAFYNIHVCGKCAALMPCSFKNPVSALETI
jgi:hypothetical protein